LQKKTVTLADVAREAGIDVSTASRALAGAYGVRAHIREKVQAIAKQLQYHPNLVARGLATGRSETFGILVSDIRNPFFAEVVRGAEDAANASGYGILLCNSDLDPQKQMRYFRSLLNKRVDGILMNSVAALSRDQQKDLAGSAVPIVLLHRPSGYRCFSTVVCDNFHGGCLAGEHLVKLGHRKMAHLTSRARHGNLTERARGFLKAIKPAEPVLIRGSHSVQGGYDMAKDLLGRKTGITAIFAANDAIAFGAMRAILEAGLRIPDNISLMGFDDVEFASIVHPPLTTISQPKYEMGHAAIEILSKLVQHRDAPPEHRMFEVSMVERLSCSPGRDRSLKCLA
jgi:DNA-binding LacI/PurR family transcriptional regulator